jgi:hypothetical protein
MDHADATRMRAPSGARLARSVRLALSFAASAGGGAQVPTRLQPEFPREALRAGADGRQVEIDVDFKR